MQWADMDATQQEAYKLQSVNILGVQLLQDVECEGRMMEYLFPEQIKYLQDIDKSIGCPTGVERKVDFQIRVEELERLSTEDRQEVMEAGKRLISTLAIDLKKAR